MKQLKLNIISNLVGRGWIAVLSLGLVPFYIKLMGVESYALVGIYTTLYSLLSLLDVGISSALNRELSRMTVQKNQAGSARNLVRTLETLYWFITGLIVIGLLLVVPFLAEHWVQPAKLSPDTVREALILISLSLAAQFPFILYTGGLQGLQRQVILNGLLITMATVRGVGAILILWLISPTILAFFWWQLFVSLLQTGLSAVLLWQRLPKADKPARFEKSLLAGIWRFAAGLTAIAILGIILSNLDKIVLSNFLTLEAFGYYSVATTVATALYMVITPVFNAVFPQLSQLVAGNDENALKKAYHSGCQILAVIILPSALVIALFSRQILFLWTNNADIADNAHLALSLLVMGTALNGLVNVPYSLMLAYGWMKFPLYQNIVAILIIAPLLIIGAANFGMVGAASAWLLLNVGYVIVGMQFMYRRLLPTEKWQWYKQDVFTPLVGALAVAVVGRFVVPQETSGWLAIISIGLVLGFSAAASFIITPITGGWFRHQLLFFLRKR